MAAGAGLAVVAGAGLTWATRWGAEQAVRVSSAAATGQRSLVMRNGFTAPIVVTAWPGRFRRRR